VKLRVFPGAPSSGSIGERSHRRRRPPKYIEAIYDGIRDTLALGVIAGHPIVDVRVVIIDGSYHDVHSSERGFRNAACLAFRDAARQAQPMLLEPIMRFSVTVPENLLMT
jgi:elongation factor G